MSWSWTSERSIESDTTIGQQLLNEVLSQLKQHAWDEQDTFGVHLAVEEALVNAIKHGNQSDPDKKVHVVSRVSKTHFFIEIRDEGDGFNPGDVPDPTADENLESPSGRGLMLMRSFMSRVDFNDAGNCVVMEKQRQTDG
ncbi:MAG TPA: ATP-binding protein [Planctomycetaceae bacterium]|nr:anti-sigma regulatory factor [Blastopirellula sp.]HAY83310.1 ATP-binding protein [Planctomycetaceae bacterium]